MFFKVGSSAVNGYRLCGDALHVVSILVLFLRFWKLRTSEGVSGKTQILLALVFTLRYMDLWAWFQWVSVYNTIMKIFYISSSYGILTLVYWKFRSTFQFDKDSFRIELLIVPITILSYFVNHERTLLEISWTWSIYMEALCLIPQFFLMWKTSYVDGYIITYLFSFSLYRGLYIFNWVYRYYADGHYDVIASTAGVVETFVGLFGLLAVLAMQLSNLASTGRGTAKNSARFSSIYLLPSFEEKFGKNYKILRNAKDEKKIPLQNVITIPDSTSSSSSSQQSLDTNSSPEK